MIDSEHIIGMDEARKKHFRTAEYFLRISAENGNINAQNDLGVIYEQQGEFKKAIFWYDTASKNGSDIGYANLGHIYIKINDYEKAFEPIKKAIEMKNQYGFYLLGLMYQEGKVVEKDEAKAYETWVKGCEYGNKYESDCLFQAGYCCEYGIGTEINYEMALKCYMGCAKGNHSVAMYNAGLAYLYGRGCEQSVENAIEQLTNSAMKEYPDAMIMLSEIYSDNKYVKMNSDVCLYWARRAARKDSLDGLLMVAEYSLKGDHMEKDLDEAHAALSRFLEICPKNDEEHMEKFKKIKKYCNDTEFWESLASLQTLEA